MRSGSVLMNMPSALCAPSPPCIRPKSTVPNTTSSLPVVLPSTSAQARWNRLAALTPWRCACRRTLRARGSSKAILASSTALPSPCTSSRPNGAVGSSTSPSMARKKSSCSRVLTPRRAWATKRLNGRGLGSSASRPWAISAISSTMRSSVVWSSTRWWVSSCSSQRPWGASCAATARIMGARRTSMRCTRGSSTACSRLATSVPSPSPSLSSSQSTSTCACRQTTCTGSANPSHSTAVRRMSWRAMTRLSRCTKPSSRSRVSKPSSVGVA
ncbi:MAG: hypothetical protein GAK34_02366 [Delftia tsuruhatensis]|nr:MAG: hypothetical protein GAK34_02366 [Delftia tsuruhatensis]